MQLTILDYSILVIFLISTFCIGIWAMRRAGKDSSEFFLSGRSMPWWLLGFSLVSTTFAADTPLLVTQIVREYGVAGNWQWWVFLLTGMTTVFIYAKLWRRIGVMTDIEFYEVRYAGTSGAFLRGFRTLYIGLICNTIIMAGVIVAMIKILGALMGIDPVTAMLVGGAIAMTYAMLGGLIAVIWADFILFLIAMTGAIAAAYFALQHADVGGLSVLLAHEEVVPMLSFFPSLSTPDLIIALLIVPLAVQWWSVWYPGAEPGGGSYVAQRMLAAKNEAHSVGAVLFFNFCMYAVRPWPWIIVALASVMVFPNLDSLKEALPHMPGHYIKDDMAYPAMLAEILPVGWAGLVLASLFAAFMSTVATHLNLGSSYMVNDFHRRFIRPKANEKELVLIGRIWTVVLMMFACFLATQLESVLDVFRMLLQIGAGTGLLFLLRWFWWRINAWSEISAMILAFSGAISFQLIPDEQLPGWLQPTWMQLTVGVAMTTIGWIAVTLLTPPTDEKTLREFVRRSRAGGPGWQKIIERAARDGDDLDDAKNQQWSVPLGILCAMIGCVSIYSTLFATGKLLYGEYLMAAVLFAISVVFAASLIFLWNGIAGQQQNEQ